MVSDYKVSIIIPNYNGKKLLKKNLPHVVRAWSNAKNKIVEVIIVDDGSTDESVSFINSNYPQIQLIKHKINKGFPKAVNTGVRLAKGNYVALLNTDVVPKANFLSSCVKIFRDEKVFAVSFNESGYSFTRGVFEKGFIVYEKLIKASTPKQSFWANGGSSLFRKDYWIKLRGMDEVLFSPFYWEDIDISYRAQKRGWKILWDPDSMVDHVHESTMKKISKKYRQRIQERNQLLFIWKNLTSKNMFKKHLLGILQRVVKHPGYIRIPLMAMFKVRHVIRLRKVEKKECKVSDEAIFARFSD
jgi:GT2 family glycosyltransferase